MLPRRRACIRTWTCARASECVRLHICPHADALADARTDARTDARVDARADLGADTHADAHADARKDSFTFNTLTMLLHIQLIVTIQS